LHYQFAEVNGTKLHYDARGEGNALVLIHSGLGHLAMWDDQMPAFAKHYRVIRFDLRGFGKSPSPPGTYSDYDDLRALLRYLKIDRTAVLGISSGGGIAIDFTLAYPEMVTALITAAPAIGGCQLESSEAMKEKRMASYEAYQRGDKSLAAELTAQVWVDGLVRSPEEVDPVVRQRAIEMLRYTYELPDGEGQRQRLEPPAVHRLAEIRAPTLVIIGDRDVPAIYTVVHLLETTIANTKKVVIHGAAHLSNMEKPTEFNSAVLEFVDGI
jgi:3-oxoadipate enol-lactonase